MLGVEPIDLDEDLFRPIPADREGKDDVGIVIGESALPDPHRNGRPIALNELEVIDTPVAKVRFGDGSAISEKSTLDHLDDVSGKAHHPLDVESTIAGDPRRLDHDQISMSQATRALQTEHEIAGHQGGLHGLRRHVVHLDDERLNEHKEQPNESGGPRKQVRNPFGAASHCVPDEGKHRHREEREQEAHSLLQRFHRILFIWRSGNGKTTLSLREENTPNMRSAVSKQILDDANVARRAMLPGETDAILRSMLHAADEGVMLTDLDHRTLACNAKFGEIFELDPQEVVTLEPEDVRRLVYPKLRDAPTWRAKLMEIYAEPMRVYEDEMELLTSPPRMIRRRTCPVLDSSGEIIGRIWTFRDISREHKNERIRHALYDMSTFVHPEPATVLQFLTTQVSEFYDGAIALLSIRNGRWMEFRCVAGMRPGTEHIRRNALKDSYCQTSMRTSQPTRIQDSRQDEFYASLLPSQMGLTRYLGAPIFDNRGRPIGTICFMDERSHLPLDDDDVRFLSLLAMRIGTELERENLVQARVAAQKAVVEQQRTDLETTQRVLTAMNMAFRIIGDCRDTGEVVERQVGLLHGLLGYSAAGLYVVEGDRLVGAHTALQSPTPVCHEVPLAHEPQIHRVIRDAGLSGVQTIRFEKHPAGTLGARLGCPFVGTIPLTMNDHPVAILMMGRQDQPPLEDQHHRTHLEALVDQVSLLVAAHVLQRKLIQAHEELRATQDRLIQSEKLSAVGTLAASIAHDIRNILASLAMDIDASDDIEPTRQAIRVQIDRFNVLAHRLLSYARPRLVTREQVDLLELFERVAALTHAQTAVAGIDVSIEPREGAFFAYGDTHQLEHVFVNLILNAVQAMDAAGGQIVLRLGRTAESLVLEVKDTGRGIPGDLLPQLFEPFQSTRTEGFGLGLYSVRRIVEDHGWSIEVESTADYGSTFRIVIPEPLGKNGQP